MREEKKAKTDSVNSFQRVEYIWMCSEEARLEFDRRRSLHGWLSLPRCRFGFAARLVRSYGRFETRFKLRCCADYYLEGSWVQWPDAH